MSQPKSDLRLRFLKHSAHFLNAQSPSTSAHLLTVHNQILIEESKTPSPSQQREFCAACGSIRVPGCTTNVFTKTRRAKKRRSNSSTPARSIGPESGIVYDCLRCHRQMIQPLQKPPRHRCPMKTHSTPPASNPSSSYPTEVSKEDQPNHMPKAGSDNAGSRRRAKARKQQGLQALIAAGRKRSQSQDSSPASLDLFDFLRPQC